MTPTFGPATWPPYAPVARRRLPFVPWVLRALVGLLAGIALGLGLVSLRHADRQRAWAACAEAKRVLLSRQPLLRYTVMSGDPCLDIRRMQGED